MLSLVADEDVHGAIISGLLQKEPALDLVCVQDMGLAQAPDPVILEWAAGVGRIVLTRDRNTMSGFAYHRVKSGLPMPGVLVVKQKMSIGVPSNKFSSRLSAIHPKKSRIV